MVFCANTEKLSRVANKLFVFYTTSDMCTYFYTESINVKYTISCLFEELQSMSYVSEDCHRTGLEGRWEVVLQVLAIHQESLQAIGFQSKNVIRGFLLAGGGRRVGSLLQCLFSSRTQVILQETEDMLKQEKKHYFFGPSS